MTQVKKHDAKQYALSFEGQKSLTKQSFKDSTDINWILKQFLPGQMEEFHAKFPGFEARKFGDASQVKSLEEMYQYIFDVEETFSELPADQRAKFDNDPVNFVDFCNDPNNQRGLTEMGLVAPSTSSAPPVGDPSL